MSHESPRVGTEEPKCGSARPTLGSARPTLGSARPTVIGATTHVQVQTTGGCLRDSDAQLPATYAQLPESDDQLRKSDARVCESHDQLRGTRDQLRDRHAQIWPTANTRTAPLVCRRTIGRLARPIGSRPTTLRCRSVSPMKCGGTPGQRCVRVAPGERTATAPSGFTGSPPTRWKSACRSRALPSGDHAPSSPTSYRCFAWYGFPVMPRNVSTIRTRVTRLGSSCPDR
jgi:hypothetical protein